MAELHAVVQRHLEARNMSLRALARALHCDASYLSRALRGIKPCGPKLARDIDDVLAADGEIIRAAARSDTAEGSRAGAAEALDVMTWLTATNTSDDAITELARGAEYLAEAHGRMPAGKVLREVLGVHRAAHALLRGGRQRLAQMRELLRIEAYREANAIALFGDAPRARAALRKAGRASEGLDDDGTSAWSFSRGRQAIFTLSVCVHTGDPDGALRAAQEADAYWAAGGGKVTATWAQVRAGAAMAYLLKDSLEGAAGQLGPVLELPPDQRISTVTGYLDGISAMLGTRRFDGSPIAERLGEEIREFTAAAATAP
jgi:hypothetical protein